MSKLVLGNITKSFGAVEAVKDFSLELQKGEFVSLLGPSGCGKTTTLRMIAGFMPPTAGTIELVLGALLMIGLFTRPVAFILAGEMAFAYFMGHMFKADPPVLIPLLNGGNAAILFCFSCLYLACAGGGVWSVDAMRERRV